MIKMNFLHKPGWYRFVVIPNVTTRNRPFFNTVAVNKNDGVFIEGNQDIIHRKFITW